MNQLNMVRNDVQWDNGKSVEESFKKIISLITQEI
jgi:ParB family chromosome partitioning protein